MNRLSPCFILLFIWTEIFSATITWTGNEDTDWHKKCNWNPNQVPTCSDDVIIPNGTTNKPTISGVAHCKTVDIQTVATTLLTISSTGSLEVGTCPTTKSEKRYVFVSLTAWAPTTSAATRDADCNTDAAAAGLCGTYKAWVSNAGANNVSNPGSGVAFYLPNGTTQIADDWSDLTDGTLDNPINQYANGTTVGIGVDVWTGITSAGTASANGVTNCGGWTDQTSTGRFGYPSASNSSWTDVGVNTSCETLTYTFQGYVEVGGDCETCYGAGSVYISSNSCAGHFLDSSAGCTDQACIFCCEGSCGLVSGSNTVDKNHYCFQQ